MAEEAKPTKTTTINNIQLTDDQFAALFGKQVQHQPAANEAQPVQAVVLPQEQPVAQNAMMETMTATMNAVVPMMCMRMMVQMFAGMCR